MTKARFIIGGSVAVVVGAAVMMLTGSPPAGPAGAIDGDFGITMVSNKTNRYQLVTIKDVATHMTVGRFILDTEVYGTSVFLAPPMKQNLDTPPGVMISAKQVSEAQRIHVENQ